MKPSRTKKPENRISGVPFTKASEKDRIKVTVSLAELAPYFRSANYSSVSELMQGTGVVVEIVGGRKVLFEVNRAGKTAATNAWPMLQPHVGRPLRVHVTSVTVVNFE